MEYAYRIVKQDGLEALEKRIGYIGKTFQPIGISKSELARFCSEVKTNCIMTFMCLTSMTLRDEFGFGGKRLKQYCERFYSLCDSIADDWLTYHDIATTIQEETGVDLVPFVEQAKNMMDGVEKECGK